MWPFTKQRASVAKPEKPIGDIAEMYAEAKKAVMWFADYIGDDNVLGEIRDEKELAAPKSAFVNAFAIVLAMEDDVDTRSRLLELGLLLSHFQTGIGSYPLRMFPFRSPEGIDSVRLADLIHSHRSEHDRFQAMMPTVTAELHALAERYQKSIDIAQSRG